MQITIQTPLSQSSTREGSSFKLTSKFYDDTAYPWTLAAPSSARYRIDCESTGVVVREWTNLTPATSISITVTGADDKIQSDLNSWERKALTLEANTGLDTQYNEVFRWSVRNLQGQF